MEKKFFNFNFLLLTANNIILSTLSTYFIILFVITKNYEAAAIFSVIASSIILVIKILSVNLRNILIAKKNSFFFNNYVILRIILSILIFIITYFILSSLNVKEPFSYLVLVLLILINWCNEISLIKCEILKNFFFSNLLFVFNSTLLFLIFFSKFIDHDSIFKILLVIITITNLLFLFINFNFTKLNLVKFILKDSLKKIKSIFFSLSLLSTFSLNFANLFWRIIIIYLVGEKLASIIIVFFALGSFTGTVFISSFGPSMVKKKLNTRLLFKVFIIYSLLLSILAIYISNNFNFVSYDIFKINFFILIYFLSIFGSLLMLFAVHEREKKINKNPNFNNHIFKADVFVAAMISPLPYILFKFGGILFLSSTYLVGSIISLLIYKKWKTKIY